MLIDTKWSPALKTFDDALALIDDWITPRGAPGVAAAVWHDGRIVAVREAGDAIPGAPVSSATIFPLASVTKPVVAAAIMTLIDDGALSLDEAVVRHVPEFRAQAVTNGPGGIKELEQHRQSVTVRQLLCHTSGLPEDLTGGLQRFEPMPALPVLIDQMARLPLLTVPGERLLYSNAGYAVLSLVVERVTGRSVWDLVRGSILEPLGLNRVTPNPSVLDDATIATLQDAANGETPYAAYNSSYWRELGMPWAGLYGTATDLASFAGDFLAPVSPVLSRAGRSLMVRDQTGGVPGGVESARVTWRHGQWGLGWEIKGDKTRHWTGDLTSPETVCHFGQAGTLLWADPTTGIALAVFANRAVSHMWTFILPAWARLSNAVTAAAG